MLLHFESHSKEPKSLDEWLCYLETIHHTEIELGLSRISLVAQRLSIDFSFTKVITVAGTNGKGTTCAFLENALLNETDPRYSSQKKNLTVAVYSSPHIERFNERLRINRCDVDDQALINAFQQIEQVRADISLSYYEFTTLAAFLVLMEVKPAIIILEVGLGGRLDATNMIDADIAVVTSVDLDHQAFLGNNREAIGFEKAGIFRADQNIIIGDPNPPKSVIHYANQLNEKLNAELKPAALNKIKVRNKDFVIEEPDDFTKNSHWSYSMGNIHLTALIPPHIPKDNVATALTVLTELGIELTSVKVNQLIENTKVAGRTEMFAKHCDIMLDVGHNPHAGRYLANQLAQIKQQQGYNNILAVVSMLADKDIANTLSTLADQVDTWYIAPLDVPRAASVGTLKKTLSSHSNSINCFDNIIQAFKMATQEAKASDLILVFGSFFTVAKVRKLLV